jgi:hypothetical protein
MKKAILGISLVALVATLTSAQDKDKGHACCKDKSSAKCEKKDKSACCKDKAKADKKEVK